MVRRYDPVKCAARLCGYNKHAIQPKLHLPSRVAWYLAWVASTKREYVADTVTSLLAETVDRRLDELTPAERLDYERSIPYARGAYGPNVRTTEVSHAHRA